MADNSEVKALSEVFFGNCWTYAGAALLAYDYILTFNSEVTLFWMGGRLSGATILFLLNRYITLAAQIFNAAPIPPSVERYTMFLRGSGSCDGSDARTAHFRNMLLTLYC
ncbi:hypothetical protein BD309DRAFT_438774 [Dichomitus squalens]|nr:hypothetical protein BD309DRAFT_438774 [Dichomitus squalens]